MVVLVAEVVLAVVEESRGMILCLKNVRFSHLLNRRDGWTDLRTDPLIEMRGASQKIESKKILIDLMVVSTDLAIVPSVSRSQ